MKRPIISLRLLSFSGVLLLVVIAVASIIPGPYAAATNAGLTQGIFQSSQLDSTSTAVLARACRNCHSNQTEWPLYSRVAPVSWLIRRDVSDGRKFLNFSQWPEYGAAGQGQLLTAVAARIKDGTMAPGRYVLLHPDARLSDQERSDVLEALEREASRLLKPMQSNQ